MPGTDEYQSEKYAAEIDTVLGRWTAALRQSPSALAAVGDSLHSAFHCTALVASQEESLRSGGGIEVRRRHFAPEVLPSSQEHLLSALQAYLAPLRQVETAEFQIVALSEISAAPLVVTADIRYELVGPTGPAGSTSADAGREGRIGLWKTQWSNDATAGAGGWQLRQLQATEETVSLSRGPGFVDVTSKTLGQTDSYQKQLRYGVDHWRTVLDGACGIDVYGNNGVAVGDIANDGNDSIYICQPSGLPNRLYRNRGDGTFEDVTQAAGVGVLDATACALFADFENKGLQDLLVVCASGPLLFRNQGNGKFTLKPDAFRFAKPPQGAFTHAAVADYDHDGFLDIYFCLYSYYVGLDQYHYPVPYFDARNGPPNILLHNEGNGTFTDRTEASGLNVDNDRYSFSCAWGDQNADGWPDLYVANDFGRSNLYRNNSDGTFTPISKEAHVEDVGAGMSATWLDFNNDGHQDIYVSNMWSAAGVRVSAQQNFHQGEPSDILANYRRHARGNTLYRNLGNGKFENVTDQARVEIGRWAWSSDSWDFDHDGWPDLYTANGYISGQDRPELSSFFWRQVVGKSPQNALSSPGYEQGWNAINELIRSDSAWAGPERNVLFANNRDGTFSEVAGIFGMDFVDDSRSFALADLDHDGRLEVILKNRNAPQVRVLRNSMQQIGHSIAFRLRGTKSNRDAIGAAVTIDTGNLSQTKYLQAGSGFLSQHSKELFFGVGNNTAPVRASVRWPSGLTQVFEQLPVNQRIELQEGTPSFRATPFNPPEVTSFPSEPNTDLLPASVDTWLLEPLSAPTFSLPDLAGSLQTLPTAERSATLLTFWDTSAAESVEQLRQLEQHARRLEASGVKLLTLHVEAQQTFDGVRAFATQQGITIPILHATGDVAGIYNLIYHYLFDRRRDLPLPTSFLVDSGGMIVKVYQGLVTPDTLVADVTSPPGSSAERLRKALPFEGTLYQGAFQRNEFTYGVAFFQHGYLEQATRSFKQVLVAKPTDPAAHYNLGTLYLRLNQLPEARQYLEQTVKLRPTYAEAWNNLGMISAQEGHPNQAITNFRECLRLKPDYGTALLNLGNLYRRQRDFQEAEPLLRSALEHQSNEAEPNYSLGMLYAQQEQPERAIAYLQRAIVLRPDYADAMNNLGVLFVRLKRYAEAEAMLAECIRQVPAFDQAYLNLARIYVLLGTKDKAVNTLNDLLRLQPNHAVAKQALELLQ